MRRYKCRSRVSEYWGVFSMSKASWFLILALVLSALTYSLAVWSATPQNQAFALAVTVMCAVMWITEALPIPVTSLLPLTLLPMLGVMTTKEAAAAYGHPLILLLLGGFILAMALERNQVHRRLAINMLAAIGMSSERRIVIGFMITAAALSMWISNTATTLMLVAIARAVIEQIRRKEFATTLLLGIAYAASVGGIGTPIGSPPNLIMIAVFRDTFDIEISFLQWMTWGVPVVLLCIPAIALRLTYKLKGKKITAELPKLDPMNTGERRVLAVFVLVAVLWLTRRDPWGGWSELFGIPGASDTGIAILGAILMFIVPRGDGSSEKLLDWATAEKIPWGILLLFGGGIAIAESFAATGLTTTVGGQIAQLTSLNPLIMILILCLIVTFVTEVTSNTATTNLLMPILAASAIATGIDGRLLMVPAAVSASCAFMLPVATAPNAIIFGTGNIKMSRMIREGFVLNIGLAVIIAVLLTLILR